MHVYIGRYCVLCSDITYYMITHVERICTTDVLYCRHGKGYILIADVRMFAKLYGHKQIFVQPFFVFL